jgi:hypothetical protein
MSIKNTSKYTEKNSYSAAIVILFLRVLFSFLSYLYVLNTGTYNGDYLWSEIKLSNNLLFINFIYTIIPFFVLFFIYTGYKKLYNRYYVNMPYRTLSIALFAILLIQIMGAVLFGVGRMGDTDNNVSGGGITFIFKVFNRLDVTIGILLYISVYGKSKKRISILLILMLLLRALLRLSLSVLMEIGFFFIINNYAFVKKIVKKYLIIIILFIVLIFPTMVYTLYNVRNTARTGSGLSADMTIVQILGGKLIGRLSSYTNSANVLENKQAFKMLTRDFSAFRYIEETLSLSITDLRNKYPVIYNDLSDFSRGDYSRGRSAMLGIQGLLLVGLYQSFFVFLIMLLTILCFVMLIFQCVSFLHYKNVYEITFIYLCGAFSDGVGYKYILERIVFCLALFLCLVFFERFMLRVKSSLQ